MQKFLPWQADGVMLFLPALQLPIICKPFRVGFNDVDNFYYVNIFGIFQSPLSIAENCWGCVLYGNGNFDDNR